jgi:N6-L-threonylcarbamoyladenine synthase
MTNSYDFSFSGLKTAVLRLAQEQIGEDFNFPSKNIADRLSGPQKANIAASFQRIAIETVVDKTVLAYQEFQPASVVIAGGVAANLELREQLTKRLPTEIEYTDPKLCTDNGAMVGCLGCFEAIDNRGQADAYSLRVEPSLSM